MDQEQQKFEQMTSAPVRPLVLKMAMPSIAIQLVTALYNLADTFFVGGLGTSETAAVGAAFPLMSVIQAMGFFFGHGTGNFLSRALGRRELGKASEMAATGFASLFALSSALAALGLFMQKEIALLLGCSETMLPYAVDYIAYILIAMPFMSSALMLNNLLRFQGSASYAMIGMVSGALLNIALDPLFIYALGMGVKGAAIATMASQMISFGLMLYATALGGNLPIRLRSFSPKADNYRQILRGGFPSLSRQAVVAIAMAATNNAAVAYGDAAVAAISISLRISALASSVMIGVGQGFQPVCGINYGARKFSRVKAGFWHATGVASAFLLAFGALSFFCAPELVSLFRKGDAQVIAIGAKALRYCAFALPLSAFSIILSMMLQTTGMSLRATAMATARQGVFYLPLLFGLAPLFGLSGILLASPIADILSAALGVPFYISCVRSFGPDGAVPQQGGEAG
jgi:putative MATE family efflux protein